MDRDGRHLEPSPSGASVATVRTPRRHRFLMRGESAVASVGIALAAILLAAMGASAWWTVRSQRAALHTARAEQVRAVGDLLFQSADALLSNLAPAEAEEADAKARAPARSQPSPADASVSALRRLLAQAGPAYGLSECRIVLSDGQVIASGDASHITTYKLPARWDRARTFDAGPKSSDDAVALTYQIKVGDRGTADLEIVAGLDRPHWDWSYWQAQAGLGTIGAAALLALLMVYRAMRSRLRGIAAIRESLLAIVEGENSPAALSVGPDLGPEAKVWNEMMADKDRSRRQGVAERARESLGRRGHGKGDLSAACDAMSQGLILVDERLTVSYANGAAAVFLRAKRDDLVGSDVSRFVQVDKVVEAIRGVAGGEVKRRTMFDVERRDDDVPAGPGPDGSGHDPDHTPGPGGVLRFSVRPVRKDDAAAAMVTIEDITQQKVAEQARHAFVAQATHELRTPLTNIRLYVETAIEEGEQNPATRAKCLNVINGEARRLERIVGEMLSVAEIEAGSFKLNRDEVRLDTVFEELRHDYQGQAQEKRIELVFNLPPKLPAIKGDRDKMMLALHNLVGNALKYTPDGGRIEVAVQVASRQLTVEVRDTGIGISPADAERIFERFYRAKDPRVAKITGSGLGLTLAREVVRLHGGDISVESQLDHGSTFTMTLPIVAEAA